MSKPNQESLADFAKQLTATLPAAVERTMAGQYERLMSAFRAQMGYHNAFMVGLYVYFDDQVVHPATMVRGKPPLLPSDLLPDFQAWHFLHKRVYADMARIKQTIASIVLRATSWQDIRNMFPDHFLRPMLTDFNLAGLQRTTLDLYAGPPAAFDPPTDERLDREAIWDPRLLNMYERVGGLIDLYLGYKLL